MKWIAVLTIFTQLFACNTSQLSNTVQEQNTLGIIADSAIVASAHPLASAAGIEILKKGGNAYDAGAAVHFALAVVFPEAGNLGGGGFAIIRTKDRELAALDFREKAPAAAFKEMYQDQDGEVITKLSRIGHKAAGVPGSVDGIYKLHQKYGKLPWSEVLKPAIRLAYFGYAISSFSAANLNEKQDDFKQANRFSPWTVKDTGWNEGDSVILRELAATLTFIQKNGREGFYDGIVADQIAKEMILGSGLITKEDLKNYKSVWRKPLEGNYKGYNIISMPPPSAGGVALLQLLNGAEFLNLSKYQHNLAEYVNLSSELEARVFADRATYLGDPDYYDVPVDMLLSESYNQERFREIKKNKKTDPQEIKEGEVDVIENVQTSHYSIVDLEGNALSVTTTLNSFYGCKVMVKGAGFFLNNEMDDFSAKPGVPNQFGLVGAEANAILPGKRMVSSMTPTIVEKDNRLFMVIGTPGGSTIITTIFQVIMNVIDHKMGMQEALNAKRFHHQWLPDKIQVENGALTEETRNKLTEMGHSFRERDYLGRVNAILILNDSTMEGGSDELPGDDNSMGY